ncbi:MAG: hypothetical protein Q8R26_00225 [bacterium]|nr:hypothetical protein [bacterium]
MTEHLLKKLKTIEPEQSFKERSRNLILNTPQTNFHPVFVRHFLRSFHFGAALSLTAVFVFLVLGGLSLLNQKILSPGLLSSINPDNFDTEIESITIQLSEVQYYDDSIKKVEVALKETSDALTDKEQRDIDALLNELTL